MLRKGHRWSSLVPTTEDPPRSPDCRAGDFAPRAAVDLTPQAAQAFRAAWSSPVAALRPPRAPCVSVRVPLLWLKCPAGPLALRPSRGSPTRLSDECLLV